MSDQLVTSERDQFLAWAPVVRADADVWMYRQESVAWSLEGSSPIALDAVGTLMFQLLDGSATVGELVEDIHVAIDIPKAVAEAQLRRIVAQLDGAALLTTSRSSPRPAGEIDVFPGPLNP
jgi:hypothetical protein